MCKEGVIINLALHMLCSAVFAFGLDHVTMVLFMRAFFKRSTTAIQFRVRLGLGPKLQNLLKVKYDLKLSIDILEYEKLFHVFCRS